MYLDKFLIEIDGAAHQRLLMNREYCVIRQYDNGVTKIVAEWDGIPRLHDVEDEPFGMPPMPFSLRRYESLDIDGETVGFRFDRPMIENSELAVFCPNEKAVITAYEDTLISLGLGSRYPSNHPEAVDGMRFIEHGNLLNPSDEKTETVRIEEGLDTEHLGDW